MRYKWCFYFDICIFNNSSGNTIGPVLILESRFSNIFINNFAKWFIFMIRFIWFQWCTLEASRICTIGIIPLVVLDISYLKVMLRLQKKSLSNRLIFLYNIVHCVNQIGQSTFAYISGALMCTGFILLVACNSIIVCGWNALPTLIYFFVVSADVDTYLIMSQTIPMSINVRNICIKMMRSWSHDVYRIHGCSPYWV